jgi:hypothetical protein
MSKSVYDKHDSAFNLVSAGALVTNGIQVGTLAFKFPTKGEGKLSCFLHLHGHQMVVGSASGYGYDKKGAALESACKQLSAECLADYPSLKGLDCDGYDFETTIKNAGFNYYRAI